MVGGWSLTVGSKEKIMMVFSKEESAGGIKNRGKELRERNNKILMVLKEEEKEEERRKKEKVLKEWLMNEMNKRFM